MILLADALVGYIACGIAGALLVAFVVMAFVSNSKIKNEGKNAKPVENPVEDSQDDVAEEPVAEEPVEEEAAEEEPVEEETPEEEPAEEESEPEAEEELEEPAEDEATEEEAAEEETPEEDTVEEETAEEETPEEEPAEEESEEEAPVEEELSEDELEEEPAEEEAQEEPAEEETPEDEELSEDELEEDTVEEEPAEEPVEEAQEPEAQEESVEAAPEDEELSEDELEEEPAEEEAQEEPVEQEQEAEEEPVEEETPEEEPANEEAPAEEVKTEPAVEDAQAPRYQGKYVITKDNEFFRYQLKASNGQSLIVSEPYMSEKGCRDGIETIKRNLADGIIKVDADKHNLYFFTLCNKQNRILCQSASYTSKSTAQGASESFMKFAGTDNIIFDEEASSGLTTEIAHVDYEEKDTGHFEIEKDDHGYIYVLVAANGVKIVTSQDYSSVSSCKEALERFKDACYSGQFLIVKDKNANFQFRLYNSAMRLVVAGEMYSSKAQVNNTIASIKSYAKLAQLVEKQDEEE